MSGKQERRKVFAQRAVGFVLSLVVLQDPTARGQGVVAREQVAQEQAAQRQADGDVRVRPDSRVNRLLDALDQEYKAKQFSEAWAWHLKSIVEIGKDAVPDLIKELDATDSDIMLRNLGFMLRAIGDKRALPALIRAFPKTLRKPGSDMGLRAEDKELLAFMQKHDLDKTDRANMYGFGRPVREISGALETLSGVKHGEEELYGVMLREGLLPQHFQRQLYRRCAERWAAWWESQWEEHVTDKSFALVRLPPEEPLPVKLFPSGAGVKMASGGSGYTAEPDDGAAARRTVFYDLDTGRSLRMPEALTALKEDPSRLDKIHDWAAQEGFDLMGTMYQPAGSEKRYYAIRALGLTAWEITPDRYQTIDGEIKKEEPMAMGRPAAGLLLHYDAKRGEYDPTAPTAFLFLTRESTYGVLHVGVEVLDTNVKIGVPVQGDPALNPVGFAKGRRFSYRLVDSGEGN